MSNYRLKVLLCSCLLLLQIEEFLSKICIKRGIFNKVIYYYSRKILKYYFHFSNIFKAANTQVRFKYNSSTDDNNNKI